VTIPDKDTAKALNDLYNLLEKIEEFTKEVMGN
jgi:uncharacterized protein with HEPN domain